MVEFKVASTLNTINGNHAYGRTSVSRVQTNPLCWRCLLKPRRSSRSGGLLLSSCSALDLVTSNDIVSLESVLVHYLTFVCIAIACVVNEVHIRILFHVIKGLLIRSISTYNDL
ncbi:hypothetical protein TNCV_2235451 [Trichonephila clavipes]|nr:hypothetical protein TNCV_2235451 [Trichonephila clavipes]